MGKRIIIAGIGTDVGKTIVSAVLVKAFRADYYKPVQTGLERDAMRVQELVPEAICHPECYHFLMPASPHQAAQAEGKVIEEITVPETQNPLVIEMAGGLMVPLRQDWLFLDWAKALDAEWVLVSRYYLGSINHTLLSLAALTDQKMKGLVFVGEKNEESYEAICSLSKVPVLLELPEALITQEQIAEWASWIS